MSIGATSAGIRGNSIVFFGRRCPFTSIPFERLIDAGVEIRAIVLASSAPTGAAIRLRHYQRAIMLGGTSRSIEQIAGGNHIPVYDVRRPLGRELGKILRGYEPELLVAACFPWRIPSSICGIAQRGGINIHPSLLPQFRGPDPLFWAYRTGKREWGVTAHLITESIDAGAILGQKPLMIQDGLPGDQLERMAATDGGELLVEILTHALINPPQARAQNGKRATYQSWPSADDLDIERNWSVQRALNFVIGVRPLGYDPTIQTRRGRRLVQSARVAKQLVDFEETWADDRTVVVSFPDGAIEFGVA